MTRKPLWMRVLAGLGGIIALAAALAAIEYLGGQPMGLFAGSRPSGLGFNAGAFAKPSWKPNNVSSTADKADAKHYVAPLAYSGDGEAAWQRLAAQVRAMPRATVVTERPGYLHVEFKSAGLGFVDDAEFALDAKAGVIHLRSGARLGIRDFGVNRARMEEIRAAYARG